MTPDVLVAGLRWLLWGLVYVGTLLGAIIACARVGGWKRVALLAVLFDVARGLDAKRKAKA